LFSSQAVPSDTCESEGHVYEKDLRMALKSDIKISGLYTIDTCGISRRMKGLLG
jgi:hypothetical protein